MRVPSGFFGDVDALDATQQCANERLILHAGEALAGAAVSGIAEREVIEGAAIDVEPVWVGVVAFVAVCRGKANCDAGSLGNDRAINIDRTGGSTRKALCGAFETQVLFEALTNQARVSLQAIPKVAVFSKEADVVAQGVHGG